MSPSTAERIPARLAAIVAALLQMSFATPTVSPPSVVSADPACGDVFFRPLEAAAGPLTVTFHGVSTLMFDDGRHRLLVDGFFSRPGVGELLTGALSSNEIAVDAGLGQTPDNLRGVLVAHGHHDHAMDVAMIADKAGSALIVGTEAVRKLAMDQGVAADRICVPGSAPVNLGAFRVTATEVLHGPSPWPLPWILARPLTADLSRPAWFGSWTDDRNLSFLIRHGDLSILVHPSATAHAFPEARTDMVFLGMARVGQRPNGEGRDYFRTVIGDHPGLVVPIHWDRFTTPLHEPLRPLPRLIDDYAGALRLLCDFAETRSGAPLEVLQMQSGARLNLTLPDPQAPGVTRPCLSD